MRLPYASSPVTLNLINSDPTNATTTFDGRFESHSESGPRLLGRVGRLGARRHGFVHLRAGAGAGAERAAAAIGNRRDHSESGVLRRTPLRAVSRGMGAVALSGVRSRTHSAECAPSCPPFCAIQFSRSSAPLPQASGGWRRSDCCRESASAASGRWAEPSSRSGLRSGAHRAPGTCTPATTSESFSRPS